MPHTNEQKEAAYPRIRVYAATKATAERLSRERGESVMIVMARAVAALACDPDPPIKASARRARRGE